MGKIYHNSPSTKRKKRKAADHETRKNSRSFSNVPLPEQQDESEEESVLSEQDIAFVNEHSNRLSFLEKIERDELDQQVLQKQKADVDRVTEKPQLVEEKEESVSEDELDGLDDHLSKTQKPVETKKKKETKLQLPMKTSDGRIVLKEEINSEAADLARLVEGVTVDDAFVEGSEPEEEDMEEPETKLIKEEPPTPSTPSPVVETEEELSKEELKRVIAVCSDEMLIRSERSINPLRRLLTICRTEDRQICHLALVSCMKVFKDIIPGYKIQPKSSLNATQTKKKLEKQELRRREYEALLLRCYQSYLRRLLELSKAPQTPLHTLRVSVTCLCGLAESLHHFNYGTDLIKFVVSWMKTPDAETRSACCKCVHEVIKTDKEGHRSLEIVQLVGDLIRQQKCCCDPAIVKSLFQLSLQDFTLPRKEERKIKKTSKNKRRKMLKMRDVLEKYGQELDVYSLPYDKSLEERKEIQTQTVEALFEIFFRVLKHCNHQIHSLSPYQTELSTHEFIQKKCPLLSICLEGLGKYAHVMSVEYFEDLLQVISKLLSGEALPFLERFQCLFAISSILKGEGEALTVDRRDFYQHLYCSISQWRADVVSPSGLKTQEAGTMLIEVCHQMLCEMKTSDFSRLAAFMKRLLTLSLHQETGISMGMLSIINKLLLKYKKLRNLMESEMVNDGRSYDNEAMDPSQSGGFLTCLWELTLLKKHFNPHLSQSVEQLMKIHPDAINNTNHLVNGLLASSSGPVGVHQQYSTIRGSFWPCPVLSKSKRKKTGESSIPEFSKLLKENSGKQDGELIPVFSYWFRLKGGDE